MAFLGPLALAGLTAGAVPVGREIGEFAGSGIKKLRSKLGFKKGGSLNPKGMSKALNQATVKRTGPRVVKKNELVIPKGLATKLKAVARRKPQIMKRRRKK